MSHYYVETWVRIMVYDAALMKFIVRMGVSHLIGQGICDQSFVPIYIAPLARAR